MIYFLKQNGLKQGGGLKIVKEEHPKVREDEHITLEMIKDSSYIKKLDLKGFVYLVGFPEKVLIVKRIGECDYGKCKNACCKFCSLPYPHEYWEGFGDHCKKSGSIIIDKPCKFINKDGTCEKWGSPKGEVDSSIGGRGRREGFPRACEEFPIISDGVYHKVMDVCTFKYKIIQEIKTLRQKTTDEMLMSFREQINLDQVKDEN